jgi:hypothetical protein
MLSIHMLRRLSDHRLKGVKTTLYKKRGRYVCGCCGMTNDADKPEYDRHTADIATISRIQMERKNG